MSADQYLQFVSNVQKKASRSTYRRTHIFEFYTEPSLIYFINTIILRLAHYIWSFSISILQIGKCCPQNIFLF